MGEGQFDVEFWKRKLQQQMEESRVYRQLVYEKGVVGTRRRILDIGCGTGSTLQDMLSYAPRDASITGIDIDPERLTIADNLLDRRVNLSQASGESLPFRDGSFDLVTFSIVLMYVKDKARALSEMTRVLSRGGALLAVMEPDYAGRMYYPKADIVDELAMKRLVAMGVDMETGRKLRYLFTGAGLRTEIGIEMRGEYILPNDPYIILTRLNASRWIFEKELDALGWDESRIKAHLDDYEKRSVEGRHFSFTPVFWALGIKV